MSENRLTTLQKAKILKQILDGKNIDHYFHELSAPQMRDLRDFLENQILDLSKRADEKPLNLQEKTYCNNKKNSITLLMSLITKDLIRPLTCNTLMRNIAFHQDFIRVLVN